MESQKNTPVSESLKELEKYDPEFRFRQLSGITVKLVFAMTLILSIFHIYTAGFGVFQEWRHRTFHLAFVLPLVFFLYSIRKEGTESNRYFIYDTIYALIGATTLTVLFYEIFELSLLSAYSLAAISFFFIIYFKRREYCVSSVFRYLDFFIFTLMLGGLSYASYMIPTYIKISAIFRDPKVSLVFWSILLVGIFVSIVSLFVIQWMRSLFSLIKGESMKYDMDNIPYFDIFFAILASAVSVYIFLEFNNLVLRAGLPLKGDLFIGAFAFLLVLEGARRSIGSPLPIISFLVLINCFLGPYFIDIPGLDFFAHRGYSVSRIIEHMYLGTEGIYGVPLGVVATFVFHFVLFGIFISKTGLGQFFMDMSMAIAGWSAGGPAKVSVISSGFMGSISGSSIANTVTTGAFTIPMMKKVGYSPRFAGAVEAASSTGGQLMPPIMGAAAFIMAEFLGIPYIKIAACAVVPALLYFFAVGVMVHLEAKKRELVGLPREILPRVNKVLREKWLLITPLFIIVYLLISGSSPFLAAFWGIIFSASIGQIHARTLPLLITIFLSIPSVLMGVNPFDYFSISSVIWFVFLVGGGSYTYIKTDKRSFYMGLIPAGILILLLLNGYESRLAAFWANMAVISVGILYKESNMGISQILETLELGTKNALSIGAACACIGFIVGATTLTGLGLKFAAAVIELARGVAVFVSSVDFMHMLSTDSVALFFTLIFTAIACFILGMGIPTTAQYIIASMIAAPALLKWGIDPLVSHMFVLFFAVLADVTPPVALAAYAASGISGANPFKTGLTAFGLASSGFVVPFVIVYAPIVLLLPSLLDATVPFDYRGLIMVVVTLFLGVVSLGSGVIGYFHDRSLFLERVMAILAAFLLFKAGLYSDLAGLGILISIYGIQRRRKRIRLKGEV